MIYALLSLSRGDRGYLLAPKDERTPFRSFSRSCSLSSPLPSTTRGNATNKCLLRDPLFYKLYGRVNRSRTLHRSSCGFLTRPPLSLLPLSRCVQFLRSSVRHPFAKRQVPDRNATSSFVAFHTGKIVTRILKFRDVLRTRLWRSFITIEKTSRRNFQTFQVFSFQVDFPTNRPV